ERRVPRSGALVDHRRRLVRDRGGHPVRIDPLSRPKASGGEPRTVYPLRHGRQTLRRFAFLTTKNTVDLRGSVRQSGLDASRIDTPHVSRLQIRQPYGTEADADGVAAVAVELLDDLVGRRIDPRQRVLERRYPDGALADRDLAARSRNADLNRRDHLVRLR